MTNRALWVGSLLLAAVAGAAGAAWAASALRLRLAIEHEVPVELTRALQVRAEVAQPVHVSVDDEITAKVDLTDLTVPIDETIEVPVKLDVRVPIDTEVLVDQDVVVAVTVPIDTVLTERELDLSQLEVPIDTEVFVDDHIALDVVLPIDTEVTTTLGIKVPVHANVPVKARVPVRQKVRVRDNLKLGLRKLRVPLKMSLPVQAHIPLKQSFHVSGTVRAPIDKMVKIPIRHAVHPKPMQDVTATVKLAGQVGARLQGELKAEVMATEPLAARLGDVLIEAADVSIERKR
jgi:hypothetical protein